MSQYIIYLHPKPGSKSYEDLEKFWNLNSEIKPNDARKYPFHATLVSFFETEHPKEVLSKVKSSADKIFKKSLISVKINNIVKAEHIKYISISSEGVDNFIKEINLKSSVINSLHITLTHNTNKTDNDIFEELISKTIDINKWSEDEWTIIMWERLTDGTFKIFDLIF